MSGRPVIVQELPEAVAADHGGAGHGAQVAQQQLRRPAVAADQVERQRVLAAPLVQLERRHPQALAEHVGALDLAGVTTDVGHVRDGAHAGHHPAPVEDRGEMRM